VQLAGREAHWMGEAAIIAEGEGADIIDINMGKIFTSNDEVVF
jgi:tRNA-dihydrouridine synthase